MDSSTLAGLVSRKTSRELTALHQASGADIQLRQHEFAMPQGF
ncbi:hypothetical protein Desti_1902 [Desulfomonile tiedjei DSM 6799]|uniref:Uncharacterized protein n=1 Tax=Desulfomonile tiedjei (strain ATCC 49306 / DSM 6799 / DCB-1) TaxID=706587 RepID=I4C4W9_DESTA|nr:hypothetical protein Desti_1902 [Desulfomonile tiedjei DSM 6799]